MNGLAALLLCIVPQTGPVVDRCDVVELNYYWSWNTGDLVLVQFIWWDLDEYGNKRVRAWRHARAVDAPLAERMVFNDNGLIRDVRATTVIESWTPYDPEMLDRQYLQKEDRMGFCGVKTPPYSTNSSSAEAASSSITRR